jgi:hypothetical protein
MVPIASAVATLEPQIAANSVQATTATSPGGCELHQRLRDAAKAHEGRHHHEQRQRHEGRRVELIDDELGGADEGLTGREKHRAGAESKHQEYRHAGRRQRDEEREKAGHRGGSIDIRALVRAGMRRQEILA